MHVGDVPLHIFVPAVAFLTERPGECAELEVQGILAGFEKLVIVDFALAPVDGLFVENFTSRTDRRVVRTPQNAVRMRVAGGVIPVDPAVVALERRAVVVPVNGHGQGVADKKPQDGASYLGREWLR